MRLRPAQPSDAEAIRALYRPFVLENAVSFEEVLPTRAEMAERISALAPVWGWLVAEADGALLGYAHASLFRSRAAFRTSAEVSVYVGPGVRRRGIGRHLYEGLMQLCRARGVRTLHAVITTPNGPSLALHAALGFERSASWPNAGFKLGRWWSVEVWTRQLGPFDAPPPARLLDAAHVYDAVLGRASRDR